MIAPMLAVCLIVLGASSAARSAVVVVLDREHGNLSPFPQGIQVTWQQDAGRNAGPALMLDGREAQGRFSLFETPRPLALPDRCRAEAWLKTESGGCQIDFVLVDGQGHERGRRKIVSSPSGGPVSWIYGACDIAVDEPAEGLACNIEISIDHSRIILDGVKVSTAESILPNGDFQYLEPLASGSKENTTPRSWRRLISPKDGEEQANATFAVEEEAGHRNLVVAKGKGAFCLSAVPITIPEGARDCAGRAYVKESDASMPEILVQQYGTQGMLKQDRAQGGAAHGGETLVSTGRLPFASGADRLLLVLSFPRQAGTWRIRAVELIPLVEDKQNLQIHTDQAGYDVGGPVRFVVSSAVFPAEGIGAFVLKDQAHTVRDGLLVPLGRAEGVHGADWGAYYFEGVVNGVSPGCYEIEARLGDSKVTAPSVRVEPRLHLRETGELAYRFYSIQRCGCEVPGWHGLCHMDDAKLADGSHVDATGGYHNAGDMHKHMGDNTPVSVYGMVCAYESAPEFFDALDRDSNRRADILDEAVWGADWMRKMVDPKSGRIWMNVTNDIDYYGIPEHDTDCISGNRDDRVINTNDPGDLGAFTIAAWAVLGRRLDDSVYLDAARNLWAVYEDRILASYEPRQVFAAIELHRSTGEAKYLSMGERLVQRLLELQNGAGWFARAPGGPPEMKIVDEGVIPAGLARFALENPDSAAAGRIRESLRAYFAWALRLADNPFALTRNTTGGAPFYFKARDDWFGGSNSEYLSVAWAANLAASVFKDDPAFAARLRLHAANQVHWILGMNPMDLCMFEGKGTSHRIYFHHLYAEIPGHERGAVPGAIPNGIIRPPDNSDRPWFDLRMGPGSPPGAESAEPWLPHNAYYLLMLSTASR